MLRSPFSRARAALKLLAIALSSLAVSGVPGVALACDVRAPTRATNPGPHDFTHGVRDTRLWQEGDAGEPLYLRARVLDTCGKPVAGASVSIVHANHVGDHEHDRWRAELETDSRGEFKLVTVFPGYTGGLPRHIHFIVRHRNHPELVTRLFFRDDPELDHGVEDLAMVLEEIRRDDRLGWVAGFEFVLPARAP